MNFIKPLNLAGKEKLLRIISIPLLLLALSSMLNALICSTLASAVNRYEARIIWLLPFAAFIILSVLCRDRSNIPQAADGESLIRD